MQLFFLGLSICFLSFVIQVESANWALLVAGSNEYFNYRHQADVCHAYQLIKKNGIPDERIVVMMYDDIANNKENPKKGNIINYPNGPNVYENVLKDYTKEHVTPENFLKVLQGEKMTVGSKKTIESGPDDNLFVFFSDHGAPGIVAFPNGDALHASELNKAIKNMHEKKKFKNAVFYIEACESGSMFDGLLPDNINVYATTASNPDESSYACYFDEERQTFLGDLYSVNWMEDSEKNDLSKETLKKQFLTVKELTNQSHVMQYGNISLSQFFLNEFQSENKNSAFFESNKNSELNEFKPKIETVKTEDVRLLLLQKKYAKESDPAKKKEISSQIGLTRMMKSTAKKVITKIASVALGEDIKSFKKILDSKSTLSNHECYVSSVDYLIEKCFDLKNDYVLRNLYVMVNLCENEIKTNIIKLAIDQICTQKFIF